MNLKIVSILFCLITSGTVFSYHESCSDGPLIKQFSCTLKGGIAPLVFSSRGSTNIVVCPFVQPFFEAAKGQKFSQMWRNYPLSIGAEFGYAVCNNVELFGEFDYWRAKARNKSFVGQAPSGAFGTFFLSLDDFQAVAGYVGWRYFFNRILCNRLSFFLGSKFGIINYREVSTSPLTIVNAVGTRLVQNSIWFESTNAVSGGLHVGFDVLFSESFSFFFNAEFVASGGVKSLFNFVKADPTIFPNFTNIVRESPGTVVAFPINIGIRFYFG